MSASVEFSATIESCPWLYRTCGANAGICSRVGGGGGGAGAGGGSGTVFLAALTGRLRGVDGGAWACWAAACWVGGCWAEDAPSNPTNSSRIQPRTSRLLTDGANLRKTKVPAYRLTPG